MSHDEIDEMYSVHRAGVGSINRVVVKKVIITSFIGGLVGHMLGFQRCNVKDCCLYSLGENTKVFFCCCVQTDKRDIILRLLCNYITLFILTYLKNKNFFLPDRKQAGKQFLHLTQSKWTSCFPIKLF